MTNAVAPAQCLTLDENGIVEDGSFFFTGDDGVEDRVDVMVCINMIHISPWSATRGLMRVAGDKLCSNGVLFCYGPYKVGGTTAESNFKFDASLKSRDPSWGVRDLEEVIKVAEDCGLRHEKTVEMPANNLSVVFRKV